TWTTSTQHFELPGFGEVSRVDNQGTTPRANGSLCFVKKHLIEDKRVSSKHAIMIQDQDNQKMSVSSFMVNETLIACIYCSPSFNKDKAMDEIRKLLQVNASTWIIAGDFNTDFDEANNSIKRLFDDYGLIYNLNQKIKSTTRGSSFIDNIFTNIPEHESGRYLSFTSYHDPLYIKFNA
ncbi:hypothetical protein BD560DRAFT_238262, partial [Blakeslea trispora]